MTGDNRASASINSKSRVVQILEQISESVPPMALLDFDEYGCSDYKIINDQTPYYTVRYCRSNSREISLRKSIEHVDPYIRLKCLKTKKEISKHLNQESSAETGADLMELVKKLLGESLLKGQNDLLEKLTLRKDKKDNDIHLHRSILDNPDADKAGRLISFQRFVEHGMDEKTAMKLFGLSKADVETISQR